MNDSSKPKKVLLDEIYHKSIEQILSYDIETLWDLCDQADKAVCEAGRMLDWIRNITDMKLRKENKQTHFED